MPEQVTVWKALDGSLHEKEVDARLQDVVNAFICEYDTDCPETEFS